jgi:hypothetical protein
MNNEPALATRVRPSCSPSVRRTRRNGHARRRSRAGVLTVGQSRRDGSTWSRPEPICRGCACRTHSSTRTIEAPRRPVLRGSGTSQAAAIMSGAAALSQIPVRDPDQVKQLLTSTAYPISGKSRAIGGGELQLSAALTTPLRRSRSGGPLDGNRLAGARPRPGPHLDGRGGAGWRAGHHGYDVRRCRDGLARGAGEVLVGWRLERQDLERRHLEWGLLEAKTWSGDSWSAKTWSSCIFSSNSQGPRPGAPDLERRLVEWRLVERWRVGHGILELIE